MSSAFGQNVVSMTNLPSEVLKTEAINTLKSEVELNTTLINKAPMSCFINYIDVNVGACDPGDNNFDLTGEIQFTDPPLLGQLIVEDCNGNQAVYNAPFASPLFYAIPDLPTDGTPNCSVTAYFTADPTCALTTPTYDNPTGCQCFADAGTFNQNMNGTPVTADPLTLCYGDSLNINANGDYTAPTDFTTAFPNITYDPGMWLLIYSCPPIAAPPIDLNSDPCLLGIASTVDQAWSIVNDFGGESTYWFVPVTMYSMQDGIYATTINNGPWCYDVGPAYEVTYLNEITSSVYLDCQAGSATATLNGGLPSYNGSDFTVQNLFPGYAFLSNTTVGNGGTVTITGLSVGDFWSFDVSDTNGCSTTVSGYLTADASFSYSSLDFCQSDSSASPTITGTINGLFSGPPEVVIDSVGVIDLINSTPGGPYTITYSVSNTGCSDQSSFDITINENPTIVVANIEVCAGDMVTLSGSGAQTYTWTGGIQDGVPFVPDSTAIYTVTGTNTATGCSGTEDVLVTVNSLPSAPIITAGGSPIFCSGDTIVLTSSYPTSNVWSTGETTQGITATTTGLYYVTYTDINGCSSTSDTLNINVFSLPTVTIGSLPPMCTYNSPHTLVEGTPTGGIYLGSGVTNDQFDPSVAGVGTHTITYKYTDANSCTNTATSEITVDLCLSVNEQGLNEVIVYPNPIDDALVIEHAGEFNFEIIDVRGRLIEKGIALDSVTLGTAHYETGVYFAKVHNQNGVATVRVVKR